MKFKPADPTPVKQFLDALTVYETGLTKIRVGNEHDGGYVVLKEVCEKTPLVLCYGVGDDVGFELDWVKKFPKSKVSLNDPFITKPPAKHHRFTFHQYGIGSAFKPIENVVQDSMLKMDVEWEEWGSFTRTDPAELQKFSQIVVEFHIFHVDVPSGLSPYFYQVYGDFAEKINNDLFISYREALKNLANWFYIYHIHANNSLPANHVDGYWFPQLLEVSMVRRDFVKGKPEKSKEEFPIHGLDFPNKTNRPDIVDYYPWGIGKYVRS